MKDKSISANDFDRLFDDGHDISEFLNPSSSRRPNLEIKRVNVDFPQWMVHRLDREARLLGVTRQSIIKTWIGDRIASKDTESTTSVESPE